MPTKRTSAKRISRKRSAPEHVLQQSARDLELAEPTDNPEEASRLIRKDIPPKAKRRISRTER